MVYNSNTFSTFAKLLRNIYREADIIELNNSNTFSTFATKILSRLDIFLFNPKEYSTTPNLISKMKWLEIVGKEFVHIVIDMQLHLFLLTKKLVFNKNQKSASKN